MKKTSFLFAAMLLSGTAFAQLQSGTKFVGIHAGASLLREDAFSKTTSFEVSPTVGYFLTNNLMVGVQGGYGSSVEEQQRQGIAPGTSGYNNYYITAGKVKTTAYQAGVTARYHAPVGEKFAFFAESVAGFSRAKSKAEYKADQYYYAPTTGQPTGSPWGPPTGSAQSHYTQELKQAYLFGTLAPGIVFFPTQKIGVELKANMVNYLYNPDLGGQVKASFSLSNTSVGAGYYF